MPPNFPIDPNSAAPAAVGPVSPIAGGAPVAAPIAAPAQGPAAPTQLGGALGGQAVAMLREGLRNVTPEERQVLIRAINVQFQDIFGRAFGPEMFEFLTPFTAEERGGQGVAPGGPGGGPVNVAAPAGAPAGAAGGGQPNPLAAIGGPGARV